MSCNRRLKKLIGLNNGCSLFPSGSAGQLLLVWPSSMGVPRCQLSHILLFQRVQAVRLSLVPKGILSPSRQDQDSSQSHHRAQQEGISCNTQASCKLLTSFCLDYVCCCPTGPIKPQVRIIVGGMIQVVDTARHRSLEPFYVNLPQNLFSCSST